MVSGVCQNIGKYSALSEYSYLERTVMKQKITEEIFCVVHAELETMTYCILCDTMYFADTKNNCILSS